MEFLDDQEELFYVGGHHTLCGGGALEQTVYDVILCHTEGKGQGKCCIHNIYDEEVIARLHQICI